MRAAPVARQGQDQIGARLTDSMAGLRATHSVKSPQKPLALLGERSVTVRAMSAEQCALTCPAGVPRRDGASVVAAMVLPKLEQLS